MITRVLEEHIHLPYYVTEWKNPDTLYPDANPDHSQNLMRSKLDQNPSFDFYQEDATSRICKFLLANQRMDKRVDK